MKAAPSKPYTTTSSRFKNEMRRDDNGVETLNHSHTQTTYLEESHFVYIEPHKAFISMEGFIIYEGVKSQSCGGGKKLLSAAHVTHSSE